MTMALEGVRGQRHATAAFYPRKDPVSIVQDVGWAPGTVWTGAKNLASPLGFDPWTVQPVAGRYTDYATLPTEQSFNMHIIVGIKEVSLLQEKSFTNFGAV
jgi:hypothetical protein